MAKTNLGIQGIVGVEICVREAEPWLRRLTGAYGFQVAAASDGEEIERTGTRRRLLRGGMVGLILAEQVHAGSEAGRYLDRHPEGIRRISFVVNDLAAAEERLLERSATLLDSPLERGPGGLLWREAAIATPLGDVEFSFIESAEADGPPMLGLAAEAGYDAARNALGLKGVDHLSANLRTIMPAIAWFEHVLGFERRWDVRFHTEDYRPGAGAGIKSVVMVDPESGVRFACNEPLRPRFSQSQVQICIDVNRGPGIHHVALEVDDLVAAVDAARSAGAEFLPTPAEYYRSLPGRISSQKIGSVRHELGELESRGILLDGDAHGYLLQAFCREPAAKTRGADAGPLLVELVERCGATGFGEGNFRALFEAMARD